MFDPCESCQRGTYSQFHCSSQCRYGKDKDILAMQKNLIAKYAEKAGGEPVSPKEAYSSAIHDFQKLLNDDYHEVGIISVSYAIKALREILKRSTPLTIEQLKELMPNVSDIQPSSKRQWIWIEVFNAPEQPTFSKKISAYYRAEADYTRGKSFCCGYPGISYAFDFADYGKHWIAFWSNPGAL